MSTPHPARTRYFYVPLRRSAGDPMSRPRLTDKADRNAAYCKGLCADCGDAPHSPGRPRCEDCHQIWRTSDAAPAVVRRAA